MQLRRNHDPVSRRIGPLHAVDENGDPVLGEDFGGAGELEISVGGEAFPPQRSARSPRSGTVTTTTTARPVMRRGGTMGRSQDQRRVPTLRAARRRRRAARRDHRRRDGRRPSRHWTATVRRCGWQRAGAADVAGATKKVSVNGAAWGVPAGSFSVNDDGLSGCTPRTHRGRRAWMDRGQDLGHVPRGRVPRRHRRGILRLRCHGADDRGRHCDRRDRCRR